jgi:hypothetical protein
MITDSVLRARNIAEASFPSDLGIRSLSRSRLLQVQHRQSSTARSEVRSGESGPAGEAAHEVGEVWPRREKLIENMRPPKLGSGTILGKRLKGTW